MKSNKNILVLCAHNSTRSQMAEAFLRKHGGDQFAVYSAGLYPTEIHPSTRQVMGEVGLPLENQHAKPVREFLGRLTVHHAIIVGERSEPECPKFFLGAMRNHFWVFPDPEVVEGEPESQLRAFREVRDGIERRVLDWLRETDNSDKQVTFGGRGPKEARQSAWRDF